MTFSFPAVIYKFSNRQTRYRYQDPFEEYKTRQEKKRAKQAAAQDTAIKKAAEQKKDDDLNWFGVKIGANGSGAGGGGGVGKYLNLGGGASLKRPADSVPPASADSADEPKKKRKIGFGNFDAW